MLYDGAYTLVILKSVSYYRAGFGPWTIARRNRWPSRPDGITRFTLGTCQTPVSRTSPPSTVKQSSSAPTSTTIIWYDFTAIDKLSNSLQFIIKLTDFHTSYVRQTISCMRLLEKNFYPNFSYIFVFKEYSFTMLEIGVECCLCFPCLTFFYLNLRWLWVRLTSASRPTTSVWTTMTRSNTSKTSSSTDFRCWPLLPTRTTSIR